ncbi:hypothetical protein [Holzapfeliella floricola]|nr:hypothetical protein [Holzapfeliella floricola]
MVQTLEDTIIKIKYFGEPPSSKEGWTLLNEKVAENIYYKIDYLRYSYLTSKNKLIKLDNIEKEEIYPQRFLVPGMNTYSFFYDDFLFCTHTKFFGNNSPVLEIRLKSSDGRWSDWQAIVSSRIVVDVDWDFSIFKVVSYNKDFYLKSPLSSETISSLNQNFDIRFGGSFYGNNLGQRYLRTEEDTSYKIEPRTRRIEFVYNPCGSFLDRVADLKKYEERYFKYDEEDNRI